MHSVWVGTSADSNGAVDPTAFGLTFSHEVVETISDPDGKGFEVIAGPNLPDYLNSLHENQIADYEPEPAGQAHYQYQIDGYAVQPYWSENEKAFVVPDGNNEYFNLKAQWTTNATTGNLEFDSQNYVLTVEGDQTEGGRYLAGRRNDTITLSTTSSGGVEVVLDGEVAKFEPGVISKIIVDGGNGNDVINIDRTADGVPITVNLGNGTDTVNFATQLHDVTTTVNLGSGADTVNLSPVSHNVSGIEGTININPGTGTSVLNVDDQATANHLGFTQQPVDYQITSTALYRTDSAVSFLGGIGSKQLEQTYYYGLAVHDAGIGKVVVNGGSAGNLFQVSGSDGLPLQINGGTGTDSLDISDDNGQAKSGANNVYTLSPSSIQVARHHDWLRQPH